MLCVSSSECPCVVGNGASSGVVSPREGADACGEVSLSAVTDKSFPVLFDDLASEVWTVVLCEVGGNLPTES